MRVEEVTTRPETRQMKKLKQDNSSEQKLEAQKTNLHLLPEELVLNCLTLRS